MVFRQFKVHTTLYDKVTRVGIQSRRVGDSIALAVRNLEQGNGKSNWLRMKSTKYCCLLDIMHRVRRLFAIWSTIATLLTRTSKDIPVASSRSELRYSGYANRNALSMRRPFCAGQALDTTQNEFSANRPTASRCSQRFIPRFFAAHHKLLPRCAFLA